MLNGPARGRNRRLFAPRIPPIPQETAQTAPLASSGLTSKLCLRFPQWGLRLARGKAAVLLYSRRRRIEADIAGMGITPGWLSDIPPMNTPA